MEHPGQLGVHRVLGTPGHHVGPGRGADTGADRPARGGDFDAGHAVDRVLDCPIAGAAVQVSFQRVRQVLLLRVGEGGCRRDHPGCAEAALESRGLEKLPLHRVHVLG